MNFNPGIKAPHAFGCRINQNQTKITVLKRFSAVFAPKTI